MSNLVIFDVDGTLLSDNNRLKRSTIEGIKELQKRNIHYTLASGRSFHFCRSLAQKIGVNGHIITCNGALIQDAFSGQILFKNQMPAKIAEQVLADLSSLYGHVNVYLSFPDFMIVPSINRTKRKVRPSYPIKVVETFREENVEDLVKITIEFFDELLISSSLKFLKQKYEDIISMAQSDDRSIDITSFQSNKGESSKRLAEIMNAENVYAFGNHCNDLEMLQFATVGIAMSNADENLKKAADFVTLSNNEDGIYKALKHFMLI